MQLLTYYKRQMRKIRDMEMALSELYYSIETEWSMICGGEYDEEYIDYEHAHLIHDCDYEQLMRRLKRIGAQTDVDLDVVLGKLELYCEADYELCRTEVVVRVDYIDSMTQTTFLRLTEPGGDSAAWPGSDEILVRGCNPLVIRKRRIII